MLALCAFILTACAAGNADSAATMSVPPRPGSSAQAAEDAQKAGLDEEAVLGELHYRVDSNWTMREEDETETGDMIFRIYTLPDDDTAALDVLRKGISLIERDALAEGKRNLGSVGQFTKQWESTYGISLTQELTDNQLPPGAEYGWVFESLGESRGGQGVLLIADMYMYAVYYAAEDSTDNPFQEVWNAIFGSVWIDEPVAAGQG